MKFYYLPLIFMSAIVSCTSSTDPAVDAAYTDSLITHYKTTPLAASVEDNYIFWKKRMDSLPENFATGPAYAAALMARFQATGDITDLKRADSLIKQSIAATTQPEPGLIRSLAHMAIQQHRFNEADSLLEIAIDIEGLSVPNAFLQFDVLFEKGDYRKAKGLLTSLSKNNTYGYLFRKAKFEHYDGSLDTAISCMMQAFEKAGNNKYLQQAALSSAADLAMHNGDVYKASSIYKQSLDIDAGDLHSLTGLGWIALVYDKNDTLAEKIFRFVQGKRSSPDILLKLSSLAAFRKDSIAELNYARQFETIATDSIYGKMYNKYLIDLYTGILKNPEKAVTRAASEINIRPTAQVYAWYVWSLFRNNQKEKAAELYKGYVSAKPLEGLELFYMGKMMKEKDKKYNATQFFKAAWKNRYDLDPRKQQYLEEEL